jgi:ATP-dependent metalloprotease FtsH
MFTEKAQFVIDLAKDCAFAGGKDVLDVESLLAGVGADPEAGVRLAECLTGGDVPALREKCPVLGKPAPCPGKLDLTEPFREILVTAKTLASGEGVPDRTHPGLIDIRHLVCGIAMSMEACRLLGLSPINQAQALDILLAWYETSDLSVSISELVSRLRGLRSELQLRIFGQDHAIHTFIEGLYNAELTAAADRARKRPAAVFVFAGPPGVGKTYMAELCASFLGRPFKRFDMTAYSDHQAHNQLVGFAQTYKDSQSGILTSFVEKNPNAILLFDEIEKAHLTTMQLFYQILDSGRLEDKFAERDVLFRDTVIIFTTNAGRSLYDDPNRIGISAANSSYHKRTILSALEKEKNPATGQPAFPQAICSRLSQGYPVMFNHLGINELERVCATELMRNESLLESQHFKQINHDHLVPICLVLREGGRVDARQLRSEAEKFIKGELFKYCSMYRQDRLEDTLDEIDRIRFETGKDSEALDPELRTLFDFNVKPKVLLVSGDRFGTLCREVVPEIDWVSASSATEVMDAISGQDIDMVLLDIWIKTRNSTLSSIGGSSDRLEADQDFVPLSARALDDGREILRTIHNRSAQTPVYLLSFIPKEPAANGSGSRFNTTSYFDAHGSTVDDDSEEIYRRPIDDELFLACVRAGGARGLLSTAFTSRRKRDWRTHRDQFVQSLIEINRRLYREKKARALARERKVLAFETSSEVDRQKRRITIRLRGFNLARAIDAMDAGEILDDVERPTTRFNEVLGAKAAKESLQFVVDWLRNPKRYSALGVRPPKGILLGGPPGTGKTMLARAVAGESDCAFIEKPASSFVTVWQGSGPQNVRDLFDRARRYAPAIVFIDEIDAIGIKRSGGAGGRAQEETLNAMLTEMDGFRSRKDQPVIVLAATNLFERLDEALKRRFDRIIEVDKPDKEARLQYLEKAVQERKNSDVSRTALERLAGQSAGMTIADLERIVHEAAVMAARKPSALTDGLLEEAFEKSRMGEARELPARSTLERVARHEAGHALIAWLGGNLPVQVTIVGRGNAGGFMESESEENRMLYTKSEIEQRICQAMGGRAAEILYYGEEEGLSTGVAGDLQNATELALRMVCEYGMSDDFGQIVLQSVRGDHGLSQGPLMAEATKASERIVKAQLDKALEILKRERSYLDALSEELLERNRLTREDLFRVLPEPPGRRG